MSRRTRVLVAVSTLAVALGLDNGVGLTPAMGWSVALRRDFTSAGASLPQRSAVPPVSFHTDRSSWNHFQGAVSDALLRECADALVSSGLAQLGYR